MLTRVFTRMAHGLQNFRQRDSYARIAGEHKWSIGMLAGPSPLQLGPAGFANPVLEAQDVMDCRAAYLADPFMLKAAGQWHMVFEVLNLDSTKGEIGWATSEDAKTWTYRQIVLAESFHLSYPYLFEWNHEFYMIPESTGAGTLRLYKAFEFPVRWSLVGILLRGYFADPSIVRHNGKWWLFAETASGGQCDTLRLYWADDLLGPWQEHPRSPLIAGDPHIARPAGRIVPVDGCLMRFAQDCYPDYGTAVRAFAISELTPTGYAESACSQGALLAGSGAGWNRLGMHHIDAHCIGDQQWIACVDGFRRIAGAPQEVGA